MAAETAAQAPLASPPVSLRDCICAGGMPRSLPMRRQDSATCASMATETAAMSLAAWTKVATLALACAFAEKRAPSTSPGRVSSGQTVPPTPPRPSSVQPTAIVEATSSSAAAVCAARAPGPLEMPGMPGVMAPKSRRSSPRATGSWRP